MTHATPHCAAVPADRDASSNRVWVVLTELGYLAGVFSTREAAEAEKDRMIASGLKSPPIRIYIREYEVRDA